MKIKLKNLIPVFILAVIAALITYSSWLLPVHPTQPISTTTVVLIAIFYAIMCMGFFLNKLKADRRQLLSVAISIVLFSGALIVSLYAAIPTGKTHAEAAEFTKQQSEIVNLASQLGKEVQSGNLKPAEAQIELQKVTNSELSAQAQAAYSLAASSPKTSAEIEQELAPKVQVRLDEWTCNSVGCSYADFEHIWTISLKQKAVATAFTGASLTLLLLVAYKKLFA